MGFPRSVQINPWLHLRFSASCSRTWRSDGPGPISKPGRYKQPETRRNIGHQPVPSFFSFQFRFEEKITCLFQPSIQPSYHHMPIQPAIPSIHPHLWASHSVRLMAPASPGSMHWAQKSDTGPRHLGKFWLKVAKKGGKTTKIYRILGCLGS